MSRLVFVSGSSAVAERIREVVSGRDELMLAAKDQDVAEADIVIDSSFPTTNSNPCLEELEGYLSSGQNVICCFDLLYPAARGDAVTERLRNACLSGSSTFLGLGFVGSWFGAELLLALSSLCRSVDHLGVERALCLDAFGGSETFGETLGFGLEADEFAVEEERLLLLAQTVMEEQVALIAGALGVGSIECAVAIEPWFAPRPLQCEKGDIPTGGLAAVRWRCSVTSRSAERMLLKTVLRANADAAPDWPVESATISTQGAPGLQVSLGEQVVDDPVLASIMRAVNAVMPVCVAPPGAKTVLDLPGLWAYGAFDETPSHE